MNTFLNSKSISKQNAVGYFVVSQWKNKTASFSNIIINIIYIFTESNFKESFLKSTNFRFVSLTSQSVPFSLLWFFLQWIIARKKFTRWKYYNNNNNKSELIRRPRSSAELTVSGVTLLFFWWKKIQDSRFKIRRGLSKSSVNWNWKKLKLRRSRQTLLVSIPQGYHPSSRMNGNFAIHFSIYRSIYFP